MALPTTREELIQWALVRLGAPVININVSEEQLEARVDEAIDLYRNYNFDGVEPLFFYHAITASTFTIAEELTKENLPVIAKNTIIKGETSGALAYFYDFQTANAIKTDSSVYNIVRFKYFRDEENNIVTPPFINGEKIQIGGNPDYTYTINSDTVLGDIDLGYIKLPERILSVTGIVQRNDGNFFMPDAGMFSLDYQFRLQNMYNLYSFDIITYDIYKSYIETIRQLLYSQPRVNFNKSSGKLFLSNSDLVVDRLYVIEAQAFLDPAEAPKFWGEEMLRLLVYYLVLKQWCNNLRKYNGISMPGGTTLNVDKMEEEANSGLEATMQRLKTEFQLPPVAFLVG